MAVTGSPHPIVEEAFKKFELLVRPNDDRMFKNTTLEDVRKAAAIISRDQSQRKCLRNLHRIKPLFDLLNKLAAPIDALCQGTPYLCYIWAPIKLMLQIADEYENSFEKLVDAYVQIAQHLPRMDRLSQAFAHQADFQSVLADIYADILEFHTYAYQFLRRGGWKHLFDASWRSFGTRFNDILRRLDRGRELLDKEAVSYEILESKDFRHRLLEDLERRERERHDWQMRDVLLWLDLKGQDREQEELMERRAGAREPTTCTWILNNPKMTTWLGDDESNPLLWLKGKPGSGKTTLATYLIDNASISPGALVLYCLCSYGFGKSESNACSLIIRSLIAQIVKANRALLPYVYDNYVKIGQAPSLPKTKALLRELLSAIEMCYIVIDGIDECETDHQKQILIELFHLVSKREEQGAARVKVLICSRETPDISRKLAKVPKLALNEVRAEIQHDITAFTMASLVELRDQFPPDIVDDVGREIVRKSNGMFLWVKLVIASLIDQGSANDLRKSVNRVPAGLRGVYEAILNRIRNSGDSYQKRRVHFILGVLASSCRPLKWWEVCDFVTYFEGADSVNDDNKIMKAALNVCKPLIEELTDNVVHIVHFSVREFLLDVASGPYLNEIHVHALIATISVQYLLYCDQFLIQPLDHAVWKNIVHGRHDLFPYVQEFWTVHLENVLHSDSRHPATSSELIRSMEQVFQQIVDLLWIFASRFRSPSTDADADSRVSPTDVALPQLIHDYISYRREREQNQTRIVTDSTVANDNSLSDPTLISDAYSSFMDAFEGLLDGRYRLVVETADTPQQMDEFRSRHRDSAYKCSQIGCIWASTGFATQEQRRKHEESHEKRFRCPEPDCDDAIGGFNSRQGLRKHKEKYHTRVEDVVLPPFPLSRKQDKISRDQAHFRTPSNSGSPWPGHHPGFPSPALQHLELPSHDSQPAAEQTVRQMQNNAPNMVQMSDMGQDEPTSQHIQWIKQRVPALQNLTEEQMQRFGTRKGQQQQHRQQHEQAQAMQPGIQQGHQELSKFLLAPRYRGLLQQQMKGGSQNSQHPSPGLTGNPDNLTPQERQRFEQQRMIQQMRQHQEGVPVDYISSETLASDHSADRKDHDMNNNGLDPVAARAVGSINQFPYDHIIVEELYPETIHDTENLLAVENVVVFGNVLLRAAGRLEFTKLAVGCQTRGTSISKTWERFPRFEDKSEQINFQRESQLMLGRAAHQEAIAIKMQQDLVRLAKKRFGSSEVWPRREQVGCVRKLQLCELARRRSMEMMTLPPNARSLGPAAWQARLWIENHDWAHKEYDFAFRATAEILIDRVADERDADQDFDRLKTVRADKRFDELDEAVQTVATEVVFRVPWTITDGTVLTEWVAKRRLKYGQILQDATRVCSIKEVYESAITQSGPHPWRSDVTNGCDEMLQVLDRNLSIIQTNNDGMTLRVEGPPNFPIITSIDDERSRRLARVHDQTVLDRFGRSSGA